MTVENVIGIIYYIFDFSNVASTCIQLMACSFHLLARQPVSIPTLEVLFTYAVNSLQHVVTRCVHIQGKLQGRVTAVLHKAHVNAFRGDSQFLSNVLKKVFDLVEIVFADTRRGVQ